MIHFRNAIGLACAAHATSNHSEDHDRITYPSTEDLRRMRSDAHAIGDLECRERPSSSFCTDYGKYWRDETPSFINSTLTPTLSEDTRSDDQIKALLASNFEAAKDFGKLLIISSGQTFRRFGSMGRNYNENPKQSLIDEQKAAAESHVAFSRYVKHVYNVDVEFVISSYTSEEFDLSLLQEWYPKGTKMITAECRNYGSRINMALSHAGDLSGYGGIFFLRPDIELKPLFFESFKLFDSLTYGYIQPQLFDSGSSAPFAHIWSVLIKYEWIDDHVLYVPKRLYDQLYVRGHATVPLGFVSSLYVLAHGLDSVNFMVNTIHITGTEKCKNPLYRVVNRVEETRFYYKQSDRKVVTSDRVIKANAFFNDEVYKQSIETQWLNARQPGTADECYSLEFCRRAEWVKCTNIVTTFESVSCTPGSVRTPGSSTCSLCPVNTYSNSVNNTCDSCPSSTTSPRGSTSRDACISRSSLYLGL